MLSTVGSWVILVTIGGIAIYCATMFVRYHGSRSWSLTSGKIESYDKVTYVNTAAGTCFTNVRYSYSVDDDYYSGVWFTPILRNLAALNQFLAAKLPVGKSVDVRYKPGAGRSVLAEPPAPAPDEVVMKTNFSG